MVLKFRNLMTYSGVYLLILFLCLLLLNQLIPANLSSFQTVILFNMCISLDLLPVKNVEIFRKRRNK